MPEPCFIYNLTHLSGLVLGNHDISMEDTIRGNGLFQAHMALVALEEDTEGLEHARGRFDESPPSYRSDPSRGSTLSPGPDPHGDQSRQREEHRWRLKAEHKASRPYPQFDRQCDHEMKRSSEAWEREIRPIPANADARTAAETSVKAQWHEHGIWNSAWDKEEVSRKGWPGKKWSHEESFGAELDIWRRSEDEPSKPYASTSTRQKNEALIKQDRALHTADERKREASRPIHQFLHQISKEREWIQEVLNSDLHSLVAQEARRRAVREGQRFFEPSEIPRRPAPTPADVNTRAYETVKSRWIEWGIWSSKWGSMPGMSWKHEEPLLDFIREELDEDAAQDEVKEVAMFDELRRRDTQRRQVAATESNDLEIGRQHSLDPTESFTVYASTQGRSEAPFTFTPVPGGETAPTRPLSRSLAITNSNVHPRPSGSTQCPQATDDNLNRTGYSQSDGHDSLITSS